MKLAIPGYLIKTIDKYNSKIKTEFIQENLEAEQYLKKRDAFWKNEKKLAVQKKGLYEKIIGWRDEFKKANNFKKLFRNESEIIVYHDSWGHEKPRYEPCDGCWSRLRLDKYGHLKYNAGYKWMPTGPNFFLTGKSLSKLSHAYLASLYKHVESGNVYKTIQDELKELCDN